MPKKNTKIPVSLRTRFLGAVMVVTMYDITLKNTTGNEAGGQWSSLTAFERAYRMGTQGTPSPSPRPDYSFALIILRSAMGRVDDNFHVVDSDVILIKKKTNNSLFVTRSAGKREILLVYLVVLRAVDGEKFGVPNYGEKKQCL